MNKYPYKELMKIDFKARILPALDMLIYGRVFVGTGSKGGYVYVPYNEACALIKKRNNELKKDE